MAGRSKAAVMEWGAIGVVVITMVVLDDVGLIHGRFTTYMAVLLAAAGMLVAVTVWAERRYRRNQPSGSQR